MVTPRYSIVFALILTNAIASARDPEFSLKRDKEEGAHSLRRGEQVVAQFRERDAKIHRPFFAQLKTASGIPLTRNHPPIAGKDAVDHDTMHPGLWLSFGDLGGHDFWRNKPDVVVKSSAPEVRLEDGEVTFSVENHYLVGEKSERICAESVKYEFASTKHGWAMRWTSVFTPDKDLVLGAQEEMGLGVRMATPLTVKAGGKIVADHGGENEQGTWGKECRWIDYYGEVGGKRVGILVQPHRDNPAPNWAHSRDYGVLVLNPTPRAADAKPVVMKRGEKFTLGYDLLFHESPRDDSTESTDFASELKEAF